MGEFQIRRYRSGANAVKPSDDVLDCTWDRHEHAHLSFPSPHLQRIHGSGTPNSTPDHYWSGRCNLTQSVKPLVIKQSAYLRVPKDVAELLDIMGAPTGAVELRIDEKGCALVYTFARPTRTITEEPEPVEILVAAQ